MTVGAIALHGLQNAFGGIQAGRFPGAGIADESWSTVRAVHPRPAPPRCGVPLRSVRPRSPAAAPRRGRQHTPAPCAARFTQLPPGLRQHRDRKFGQLAAAIVEQLRSGSSQLASAPSPAQRACPSCGGGWRRSEDGGGGVDRRAAMLIVDLAERQADLPLDVVLAALEAAGRDAGRDGAQHSDDAIGRPADLAQRTDNLVQLGRAVGAGRRAIDDQFDDVLADPRQPCIGILERVRTLHRCRSGCGLRLSRRRTTAEILASGRVARRTALAGDESDSVRRHRVRRLRRADRQSPILRLKPIVAMSSSTMPHDMHSLALGGRQLGVATAGVDDLLSPTAASRLRSPDRSNGSKSSDRSDVLDGRSTRSRDRRSPACGGPQRGFASARICGAGAPARIRACNRPSSGPWRLWASPPPGDPAACSCCRISKDVCRLSRRMASRPSLLRLGRGRCSH